MATKRIKFIVPFPLSGKGLKLREAQLPKRFIRPGFKVDFVPVKNSIAWMDSYYDSTVIDFLLFEEGISAEKEGYDAVCIDTASDSGLHGLRSRLKIPVVAPSVASMHLACMLGHKFTVLTMWERWVFLYSKHLEEYKLWDRCASVRNIGQEPNLVSLLEGKKETLKKLEAEALKAIEEDGADVIMLGSTTMHQAHDYLSKKLPVPVLNPGLVAYKIAEVLVELNLSQSKVAYPAPRTPRDDMVHAMAETARKFSWPPK